MKIKLLLILLFFLLFSCSNTQKLDNNETTQNNLNNGITKDNTGNIIVDNSGSITGTGEKVVEEPKPEIPNPDVLNIKILGLIESGKIKEAEVAVNQIEDKSSYDYLYLKGKISFEEKLYKEALAFFLQADSVKGDNIDNDNTFMIGVVYDNLGEKVKAKEYFNKALKIKSTSDLAKEYLNTLKKREQLEINTVPKVK